MQRNTENIFPYRQQQLNDAASNFLHQEILDILASGEVDVNHKDIHRSAVLHYLLADEFRGKLNMESLKKCLRVILSVDGADINITNKNNETPLHLAIKNQFYECVQILLDKNAKLNIRSGRNREGKCSSVLLAEEFPEILLEQFNKSISHSQAYDGRMQLAIDWSLCGFEDEDISDSAENQNEMVECDDDDMRPLILSNKVQNSSSFRKMSVISSFLGLGYAQKEKIFSHPLMSTIIHLKSRRISLAFPIIFVTFMICYLAFSYNFYFNKCGMETVNVTQSASGMKRIEFVTNYFEVPDSNRRHPPELDDSLLDKYTKYYDVNDNNSTNVVCQFSSTMTIEAGILVTVILFWLVGDFLPYIIPELYNTLSWRNWVNRLALFIIFLSLLPPIVADNGQILFDLYPLAGMGIFFGLVMSMIKIGSYPRFSIYIEMVAEVFLETIKICCIFLPLFVGVFLGFNILNGQKEPSDYPHSVFHFILMIFDNGTGEYEQLTKGIDGRLNFWFELVGFVFAVTFMITISIVFVNFMIGATVNDIKNLRRKAEIKSIDRKISNLVIMEDVIRLMHVLSCYCFISSANRPIENELPRDCKLDGSSNLPKDIARKLVKIVMDKQRATSAACISAENSTAGASAGLGRNREALKKTPLCPGEVSGLRKCYGLNVIGTGKRKSWYRVLFTAMAHPFNILLCILATASGLSGDLETMGIMLTLVAISSGIRFQQEWKSYRAALGLLSLISKKVKVLRYRNSNKTIDPEVMEIGTEYLVPGDWVQLEPGNLIPADLLLVKSKDLYISQATLTGEAIPVEKFVADHRKDYKEHEMVIDIPLNFSSLVPKLKKRKKTCKKFIKSIFGLQTNLETEVGSDESRLTMKENLDRSDMCYMGTSVVTGTATAIVKATGSQTYFGLMAESLGKSGPQNAFQLGVRRISWIFFLTMACLVPPVLMLQGFLNKDWSAAFLFALSVAVGLNPEMLPMIVNITLAKGAYQLAVRKCIVKSLDSVVNLGGMDVLCTDKTGTLTQSVITLHNYIDPTGQTSEKTLLFTYLNSFFQSVHSNPMDTAVLHYYNTFQFQGSISVLNLDVVPLDISGISKVDEIPFDFNRRRTSVILKENVLLDGNGGGDLFLICKGATDEMLSVCTGILNDFSGNGILPQENSVSEMTEDARHQLREMSESLSREGLRVLGVAYKRLDYSALRYDVSYEQDLIFVGFVGFLDPPKESTKGVINELLKNNVRIKVLTGDSSAVCQKICQEIDLPVDRVITSVDMEDMDDERLSELAERGTIFSKLTPIQKADVVRALKRNGHIVGFLGDGINDSPALLEADVGISVDSGTDIAKESADIILLEKNLGVIGEGVIIGRAIFGNTLKYIVMAVSSNFGNVLSMLVASSWLPFLPMRPIHVLVQNLLYDISQIAIPWDHMDPEFLAVPHQWSMKKILKFMVFMGPWSSVFDITTFVYMYFYYGIQKPTDDVTLFQTTWFVVGLLTQTLIVHMIRTPKIPFIQSRASLPVTAMTILIMSIGVVIPCIPGLSDWLHMTQLRPMVYPYIIAALLSYAIVAQLAKVLYIRVFNDWF